MRVAIIGTGNIGTDLLLKILKTKDVKLVAFVGRRAATKPLPPGVNYYENGIDYFIENPNCCDLVFDCTDALTASINASIFEHQNIRVIDMTPSKKGQMCVPNINCCCLSNVKNVNMITCGGQVSIPMLNYLASFGKISYAEVVTQISSHSAGMATRINVDKYIETTENAIKNLVNVPNCKVILTVNPAKIFMQTTIFIKTYAVEFTGFEEFLTNVRSYIPNYNVASHPKFISPGVAMVSVKIASSGDYFSDYAGNLDVINCAAMEIMAKINKEFFTVNTNERV
jgi:acetaldehyde dehydrogenase (acetylating)